MIFDFELSVGQQIVIGLALSVLISMSILVTQSAFVLAPEFSIFDSALGNALVSGLVGLVETWVFFGFAFPTIYALSYRQAESEIVSLAIALVLATGFFTGFHWFVYRYSETSMMSVAFFGFLNCMLAYITRSNIVNNMVHFSNNMFVTLLRLSNTIFQVVI